MSGKSDLAKPLQGRILDLPAVLAIQTYDDQLNFHPHLHSLVAEGGWGRVDGTFQSVSWLNSDIRSAIFRRQVLENSCQYSNPFLFGGWVS